VTPATWWALAFITACVVLIVWVRVKYPLPEPGRSRRGTRRRASASRRSSGKSNAKVRQR